MVQQIVVRKRFGTMPVGNPTLKDYPKHSNIVDCLNDRRILVLWVFEVRSGVKVRCELSDNVVFCSSLDRFEKTEVPRETSKLFSFLESVCRTEKNPRPKFRLETYFYNQN